MYRWLLKPLLFRLSAETAHRLTVRLLKFAFRVPFVPAMLRSYYHFEHPKLARSLFGLTFPNPVGLAAGLDKNAEMIDELASIGFGFIEIGTLTPKPQEGNPKPRLFRLPTDEALINRMGFNNEGVAEAITRLRKRKSKVIVGGNIGKNKNTPNEQATDDYVACFDALYDWVDYFVVNVSSPNTPNLRALQEREPLEKLLNTLQARNNALPTPKPILLKIAPDLTNEQLDEIIEVIKATQLAGVIATNTTISRQGLHTPTEAIESMGAGGLSGKPLRERATEVIKYLKQHSNNAFPIIGVGGIHSPEDAIEKLQAGADLVQIYTGFVYEGPALVRKIKKGILQKM
ncbi:MAG: quinone-dependent dihydroorotate dehydrogenase [Bacteroidetes bacterium]|nr:MAG: quinone-dependent dihydroorotate dehydrogenase [Bacteroidota bacterium]